MTSLEVAVRTLLEEWAEDLISGDEAMVRLMTAMDDQAADRNDNSDGPNGRAPRVCEPSDESPR